MARTFTRAIPSLSLRLLPLAIAACAFVAIAASQSSGASSAGALHVADLDGVISTKGGLQAKVTVTVHDASHRPVGGATVSGVWVDGVLGTTPCVTSRKGTCTVTSSKAPAGVTSITLKVVDVRAPGAVYDGAANHDPDGSSDGTFITVVK